MSHVREQLVHSVPVFRPYSNSLYGILALLGLLVSAFLPVHCFHHHTRVMSDLYRDSIFWVEVERIQPNPFQPRREFDQSKLEELAESIRMYGLLQPLTVTRKEEQHPDGGISVTYELIAGERRLRASKIAGVSQVPVIIRTGEDDDRVKLELAIIENLQREDLNPVDRAYAFQKLYKDFNFTHAEIGKKMGKSREYVSNTLRLLSLPEAILTYLAEGRVTEGHTRALLMLSNKPEEQMVLAREVVMKKLTVRETEGIARRSAQDRVTARHKIDPNILSVEQVLTERLGTRVTIEPREVGGRLVISFFSAEDLQALMDAMRVDDERAVVNTDLFKAAQAQEVESVMDSLEVTEMSQQASPASLYTADVPTEEPVVTLSSDTPAIPEFDEAVDEVPAVEVADEAVQVESSPDLKTSGTALIPDSEELPKEQELSAFETFLRALTGHGAEQKTTSEEPVAHAVAQQTENIAGAVEPSPARPMPEPTPEPIEIDTTTLCEESKEEKKEDDADLYSIRNFSI